MVSNLESPSDNSFKNINENEYFDIIILQNFGQIEMIDDLDDKNLDYLYCLNKQNSKNISKSDNSLENYNSLSEIEDGSLNLDDFELFYKKFANIKEEEESLDKNKNDVNNPN